MMSWKDAVSVIFSDTFGYKYQTFSYSQKSVAFFHIYSLNNCKTDFVLGNGVSWTSWFERKLMLSGRITGEIGEVGKSILQGVVVSWH